MNNKLPLKKLVLHPEASLIINEMLKSGELKKYYPELEALNFSKGGHKNNFIHSLKVLENSKELAQEDNVVKNDDYILFIAALYHDVGKPATYARVNGKPTFQNHEYVGAKMMNKILKNNDFSKSEILEIKMLIANHMRGHTFANGWSDSAIRRLAKEAGSIEQIHRLGIIFASDATTKYEEKRKRFRANALRLRDAMLEILEKDEKASRRPAIDGNKVMEISGLKPGKELGQIMRFLNSEEGLALSESEAIEEVLKKLDKG